MKTSESIKTIAPALLAAKKAFKPALKTAENPHFKSKYVDLQSVVDATEDALLANGLMVLQTPGTCDNLHIPVTTRLVHVSGEWFEDTFTLPAGTQNRYDAQTVCGATTYARRYSYMGILGIAPEDDDGSTASGSHAVQQQRPGTKAPWPQVATMHAMAKAISPPMDSPVRGDSFEPDPLFDENGDLIESVSTVQHREQKQAAKLDAAPPSAVPAQGPVITEAQAKRFLAIAKGGGKSWPEIDAALESIGVKKAVEIPRNQYDQFIEWAGGKNERRA